MARKKEIATPANGGIAEFMQRMASRHSHVYTADEAIKKWRYLDFCDPRTGLPTISQEWFIGARGFVAGRIAQLRASYSQGKSSYCMLQYGAAQRKSGAYCMHVETEGAGMTPDRIYAMGVDPKQLLQLEIASLEDCLSEIDNMVCEFRGGFGGSTGATGRSVKTKYNDPIDPNCEHPIIIGIDSLSSLGKTEKVEQDIADISKATQISYTSKALREYFRDRVQRFVDTQTMLILTTQETTKIEMGMATFAGPKKTSIAAEAIGIHATYGIDFKSSAWKDNSKGIRYGDKLMLTTFKNKVSPRNRNLELFLTTNNGFDMIHTDAEFLISKPESPLSPSFGLVSYDDRAYRTPAGIMCRALQDHSFKSEEEFVRAFYDNTDLLMTAREKMRIRGFGFDFETKYDQFDRNGNLKNEVADKNNLEDTEENDNIEVDKS